MPVAIANIIRKPYPVSHSKREILLSSLFIAVTGYLFLVVFQPFGAATFNVRYKYLLLVPYSLIAFGIYSGTNLYFRRQKNWNLLKELAKITAMLLLCSVLNYVYNIYFINHVSFDAWHLLQMFFYTFSIAVPVSVIYVLARYLYLAPQPEIPMEALPSGTDMQIEITADAGSETLAMAESDFLFAESDGNYATIHYLRDGNPARALLRLSLKNLESQLSDTGIIRCHRSFVVNPARVSKMKGNAQGYKLFVDGLPVPVLVSRSYIPAVDACIKRL